MQAAEKESFGQFTLGATKCLVQRAKNVGWGLATSDFDVSRVALNLHHCGWPKILFFGPRPDAGQLSVRPMMRRIPKRNGPHEGPCWTRALARDATRDLFTDHKFSPREKPRLPENDPN